MQKRIKLVVGFYSKKFFMLCSAYLSTLHIPDDGGLVHTSSHNVAAFGVPLEGKDGARVLHEGGFELPLCGPQPGHTIVGARCQHGAFGLGGGGGEGGSSVKKSLPVPRL